MLFFEKNKKKKLLRVNLVSSIAANQIFSILEMTYKLIMSIQLFI